MIIGLTGYAQSGKDSVAKILVEKHGFIRVAFADRIRDFVFDADPIYTWVGNEPRYLRSFIESEGWEEAKGTQRYAVFYKT